MKVIGFIFLALSSFYSFSQRQEVSVAVGYGAVDVNELIILNKLQWPFSKDETTVFMLGGGYHYNIGKNEYFRLNTGIFYHTKSTTPTYPLDPSNHYLLVPIGVNLDFGKKFHVLFGGGLNFKFSLKKRSNTSIDFKKRQFGRYFNLGMGYRVSNKIDLTIEYRTNRDITRYYKGAGKSPGGAGYSIYFYEASGTLQLGVSYTLSGRETNRLSN